MSENKEVEERKLLIFDASQYDTLIDVMLNKLPEVENFLRLCKNQLKIELVKSLENRADMVQILEYLSKMNNLFIEIEALQMAYYRLKNNQ